MPRDELRQPLRKRSLRERLWSKRPSLLATVAVLAPLLVIGGGIWVSRLPHPFAGEPVVVAAIPPPQPMTTASTDAAPGQDAAADEAPVEEAMSELPADPGPAAEPPPDYSQEASIVVATHRPMKPAPMAAVSEDAPDGPLPRVSARGKKPSEVYAQVTPLAVTSSARPKIAILLGGMGINQRLTQKAIKDLPGDITFGFAPYGDGLQDQVNKARAKGHEVMLQLPLEPAGFPGNNPGPHTLLADQTADENLKSLHWHMSRFAGYTGITNYMGSRFLATPDVLKPVMQELKARGLLYLEDATVNVSVSHATADEVRLPMQRGSVVIDANPDAASIRDALHQLEQEAEANGFAIGTGAGLEVTIDTVNEWANELKDKGILLIPVSAAYKGRIG